MSQSCWHAWRIADGRFEPFCSVGASLVDGRWNSPGNPVIYANCSFAGAMLECLAHAGIGRAPRTQVAIEILIPASVSIETHTVDDLPSGWDQRELRVSRRFGNDWLHACRTAVLIVPSVVARRECNVVLNPRHPDFRSITVAPSEPVIWDTRLFASPTERENRRRLERLGGTEPVLTTTPRRRPAAA